MINIYEEKGEKTIYGITVYYDRLSVKKVELQKRRSAAVIGYPSKSGIPEDTIGRCKQLSIKKVEFQESQTAVVTCYPSKKWNYKRNNRLL